jgi:SAM-dependent methyltransferase
MQLHHAPELMYQTKELFEYAECPRCACLRLLNPPQDYTPYYASDSYYSHTHDLTEIKRSKFKRWLNACRVSYALGQKSMIGAFYFHLARNKKTYLDPLKNTGVSLNSKILDVGCGDGQRLRNFRKDGFIHLVGIDPFMKEPMSVDGLRLMQQSLQEHDGQYDLIMFNHSYEHMSEPREVLVKAKSLLRTGGKILIAIPLADSYARWKYGIFWNGWDAPRHLYLHSQRSLTYLLSDVGLKVVKTVYQGGQAQFFSDAYVRGFKFNQMTTLYDAKTKKQFEQLAQLLNHMMLGDQATFIIERNE